MTDFSQPRRMGGSALLILFAKQFRIIIGYFIILILARIYRHDPDYNESAIIQKAIIIFVALVLLALIITIIQYYPKKFYVNDGNLIFTHGIISSEATTIPLTRIHSLRTNRGVIYRILGMRGIKFDTLASKGTEIELIISETDWQSLQTLINKAEQPEGDKAIDINQPAEKSSIYSSDSTIVFKNTNLLFAALCQNHLKGFAILAGVLAAVYDNVSNVIENTYETIEYYASEYYAYAYSDQFTVSPLLVIFVLLGTYFGVLLLWLGKTFILYYDMMLRYNKKLLTFSYGLMTRNTCRFPIDKVCTIWVKRNFLEKKFGLCTLMLKQAFNATANKKDDNLRLYGKDSSAFFLTWWLGDDSTSSPIIEKAGSGKSVIIHTMIPDLIISLAASIVLWHLHLQVWMAVPIIYVLISLMKGVSAMHRSKIILRESYLEVHNGRFADIRNYLKYDNIEVILIKRSPFTRLFHRASLTLSSPGTTFTIRSLNEDDAAKIYEIILTKTEESKHIAMIKK